MVVVLVHPWLGELRRYHDDELTGSLGLGPEVRAPRADGTRNVEVLLHVPPTLAGAALRTHVGRCAERISSALQRLEAIKHFTVEHAPPGWAEHYAPATGTLTGLLFLDGVEAGPASSTLLVFDFGDLDQLVTRVDDTGNGQEVSLRA